MWCFRDDKCFPAGLVPAPEYLHAQSSLTPTGPAPWESSPLWNQARECAPSLKSRSRTSASRVRTGHSKVPGSPITPPTWWWWRRSSYPPFVASPRRKPLLFSGFSLVSGLRCRGSGVCADPEAPGYRSVDLESGRSVCLSVNVTVVKYSRWTICQRSCPVGRTSTRSN